MTFSAAWGGGEEGWIDLIYLDPPFNSNRNYAAPIGSKAAGAAFKDAWTLKDYDAEWMGIIAESYPELSEFLRSTAGVQGKGMQAYLIYMAVRLFAMRKVLKSTGCIYLHCDPTASHYLKVMMDCIFGKQNFKNEIVWQRSKGGKSSQHKSTCFGKVSDTILYYASKDATLNALPVSLTERERNAKFPKLAEDGRRYCHAGLERGSTYGERPNLCYEWRGFTNRNPSGWCLSKPRMEEEYQKGNIVIRADGKLERRKYEEDYKSPVMGNIWTDIPGAAGKERTDYPTQKPLALLRRIILASSNEGDIVLDPFCGCATACVAAQDTGRKWIGIDLSPKAYELIQMRFKKELGLISPKIIHRTDLPHLEGTLSKDIKHLLYGKQEGLCNGCEHYFHFRNMTRDHIVPTSKGGPDSDDNLQLLCGACNSLKGNRKTMPELKAELRRQNILHAA